MTRRIAVVLLALASCSSPAAVRQGTGVMGSGGTSSGSTSSTGGAQTSLWAVIMNAP